MSNFAHIKTIRACDDGTTRACDDGLIRTCDDGTNPSSSTPGKKDQPQIFRFKITDEIMKLLFQFAKIHQHDDRKSYKEAWEIFVSSNNDIIEQECRRLKELGYTGNCLDKMYKSSRYYFRKKSTADATPKKRRKYFACDREILDAMDLHISDSIRTNNNFKPSDGYNDFVVSNKDLVQREVVRMIEAGFTCSEYISNKIKKTYKNRHFQLIH